MFSLLLVNYVRSLALLKSKIDKEYKRKIIILIIILLLTYTPFSKRFIRLLRLVTSWQCSILLKNALLLTCNEKTKIIILMKWKKIQYIIIYTHIMIIFLIVTNKISYTCAIYRTRIESLVWLVAQSRTKSARVTRSLMTIMLLVDTRNEKYRQ